MDQVQKTLVLQEWLKAEPVFAQHLHDGSPVLILQSDPLDVSYASKSALAFFSVRTCAQLAHRLQTSAEQGARRLRDLATALPGNAQRLERLRFASQGAAELQTCLVRKIAHNAVDHVLLAVLGLSEAERRTLSAAPDFEEDIGEARPAVHHVQNPHATLRSQDDIGASHPAQSVPPKPARPAEPQRFTFQTDGKGKITSISPDFSTTGLAHADTALGGPFPDSPSFEALTTALTGRQTWRNVEVHWPMAEGAEMIPVSLSGSPIVDVSKNFVGFRGFGIAHFDRAETVEQIVALPTAEHRPADADPGEPRTTDAADSTEPQPELHTQQTGTAQLVPGAGASVLPHEAAGGHALATALSEAGTERDNIVALNPAKPYHGLNDQEGVLLSTSERMAFREIARALGARMQDEAAKASNEQTPEPSQATHADARNVPAHEASHLPLHAAGLDHSASQETVAALNAPQPAVLAPHPAVLSPQPEVVMVTDPHAKHSPAITAQEIPAHQIPVHQISAHQISAAGSDHGLASNSAALLDRLPVGILVSRGDVPIFTNKVFLEMLGYADADQFYEEDGLDRLFAAPHVAPAESDKDTMALQTRSGDILHVEAHLQSLNWNGDPASMLAFRRVGEPDHSAKLKKLELELRARESEARELHAILDTATDGVVVLDDKGNILEVNRSAEALLGFEQSEVAGQPFTVLLNPESHAAAMDYLDGLKSNGVASVLNDGRDVIGRERHGGAVPLFMTLGRVGNGQNSKFCAVLRDVTHWKKAERELNEARKQAERTSDQKSDFLAKISHEIRTPLNAIIGFTEVIWQERFGPVGNERYKDYLKDIHASGMHVMSLVNDLLDLTKIESGNLDLSFTSVNANTVIQECVALMQPQATKERVIIRVSLAPRLPNIVCDERSLKQIVINLLSNAVKFNDPGGQVIVSTALTDAGHAVIRVRDTGIGMNESDVERALEPFRQLETSRKANGTGLGLPLTKAMVEANRASFTIKSKRGEGTLVEVMFPPTRVLAE